MNNKTIQRSISIPLNLNEMVNREAEENLTSFNSIVRKILTDYFKQKEGEGKNANN